MELNRKPGITSNGAMPGFLKLKMENLNDRHL